MQVHQFVHTLNYGDAISGEAIAIRRLLRERGLQSEIYSVHSHEKVNDCCTHWSEFRAAIANSSEPVAVVLHYSIASPLNDLFRELVGVRRALIHHNLTPISWFASYNARVASDLTRGIAELPQLLTCVDLAIADSEYNRQELVQLGCPTAAVLPLFLDPKKWSVPANPGIVRNLRARGEKNILHVGRIAPNKCIEDIIKCFYFYHHKIERKSKLWLVGADIDTEIYSFELRRLVSELRLQEAVQFTGSVSDDELRAFYECSDAYLCMSEHEGFCVPLLEAMHFNVPIIAYGACAVSETLGDAGLLLQQKAPAETAELLHILLTDQALRSSLVARGSKRVMDFSESRFLAALDTVLLEPLRHSEQRRSSSRGA